MSSVVIIAGPTASGKSRMAIDVARQFDGTVINADSMQVYRELDLLTARPPADDLNAAEHKLYGVLSASEACSVGRWLQMATAEIDRIQLQQQAPKPRKAAPDAVTSAKEATR